MKRDMKISVLERAGNPCPGTVLLRPKPTSQGGSPPPKGRAGATVFG